MKTLAFDRMKKTLSLLLIFFFVVTISAGAAASRS